MVLFPSEKNTTLFFFALFLCITVQSRLVVYTVVDYLLPFGCSNNRKYFILLTFFFGVYFFFFLCLLTYFYSTISFLYFLRKQKYNRTLS